jgi:nicotinamidase-related amidase
MTNSVDRLILEDSLLLLVDVQGKLARLVHESETMIRQLQILIEGCRILEVPIIWAEQLPEKLGDTLPELVEKLDGLSPHVKSSFGCCEDHRLYQAIRSTKRNQVILSGIETHVCVWQTAAVLQKDDFQVHLVTDATSSRSVTNRDVAVRRMVQAGIHLSSVEMALFELMKDANHPRFREITRLLK